MLAALGGFATAAEAQTVVRGHVLAAADSLPVSGALVTTSAGASTYSDGSGRFALAVPAAGATLYAVRIGFAADSLRVGAGDAPERLELRLEAAALAVDPLVIGAARAFSAASSRALRELDLRLRPYGSSQELLRLAPGLVIAQHAGGGKAEQIFLRGFDADHGTDVAITVDGVPVNMVSHAHGQGYADLHFLMPELVDRVEVRKGPYDPADGDFATAGAVAFHTVDRLAAPRLDARTGSFGERHAFAGLPFGGDAAGAAGYIAVGGDLARGPFEAPQGYRRGNAHASLAVPLRTAHLTVKASSFLADWDASGQVPQRAVEAGSIGRFGAIDATEGGRTSRTDVNLLLADADDRWDVRAFATRYDFRLFSNFTFFLRDRIAGDGIEQVDGRLLGGGELRVRGTHDRLGGWTVGTGARADRADVALHDQVARTRIGTRADAHVAQDHLFAWTDLRRSAGRAVHFRLGARADLFRFDVGDRTAGSDGAATWHARVSPRASVAFDIRTGTTVFANAGLGFHSNDARAVASGEVGDVLPRATGVELGARHTWGAGSVGAAAWLLDLGSELTWVGDEGVTEAGGPTRRIGVEADARLRLAPWLWADVDINLARGRARAAAPGEDRIPLAPSFTSSGGFSIRDTGPFEGQLRYRRIGDRPADEAGAIVAPGAGIVDAAGAWRIGRARIQFALDNLFDTTYNEAQFATTSRLRGEAAGVTELHFTPGAPRAVRLGLSWSF
jgi:outer membrane receptor protein involved in Fe transport